MNDEPIERAVRDWLVDHTELEAPASLIRHLDQLVGSGGATTAAGKWKVQPVSRRVTAAPASRRGAARAVAAIAAVVVVALVGGGLIYGLANRTNPPVSGSPTPGPSDGRHGSASPPESSSPAVAVPSSVMDAALVDPSNGWAWTAGDLVWTTDGGRTWRSIRPADVDVSTIRAVRFVDTRIGWLAWWSEADPRVTIERTNDGGRTWSRSHTPGTHPDGIGRVSIDGFDNGHLFVQVETVHSSASCVGELDGSDDAGISWRRDVAMPSSDLGSGCSAVRFRDPAHGWTTAGPLSQALESTADGGRTWTSLQLGPLPDPDSTGTIDPNTRGFQIPIFDDGGRGPDGILPVRLFPAPDSNIAGRSGRVAIDRTTDGGATWQVTSGPPDPLLPFEDGPIGAAALGPTDWLVAGSSLESRLWRTSDAGSTWAADDPPGLASPIASLGFVDAQTGWAIDLDGALHATDDSGRAWRTLVPRVTEAPQPSATIPPVTGTSPFAWTLVSSEGDLATYDIVQAIVRPAGGWIGAAFGQEARTVHSDDGATWVLDPADPGLVAAPANHLTLVDGLASGPNGLVAVGASALDDFSSGEPRAWTSADGLRWHVAARVTGDANAEIRAVVGGKLGYIAVGSDGFPGANVQLPGAHGAATWISSDGASWVRAQNQAAFTGAIMTGVAATPRGFVAWGEIIPTSTIPNQALPIWTSADGVTWTRTRSGRAETSFTPIGGVVVLVDRWVAVGTRDALDAEHGGTRAAVWTSTDDGRTWTAAPVGDAASVGLPSTYLFDVAAVDADVIAVGHAEGPDLINNETSAAVWWSTDFGRTWTQLADDPSFRGALIRRILPLDANRFVVFGQANDANALMNPNLIWLATRQP